MSNEKKPFSREFKAKVVLEVVSGEHINPHEVAEKYDINPSDILAWAHEMDISDVNLDNLSKAVEGSGQELENEVEIEIKNDTLASEIEYGVTFDYLDMKKLTFWSVFGTVLVILIIQSLIWVYGYSSDQTTRQVLEGSEYREINQLKLRDEETLSSFGVVDLENGIYRMPIDTVITRMAQQD